jgi:hypothetical protein
MSAAVRTFRNWLTGEIHSPGGWVRLSAIVAVLAVLVSILAPTLRWEEKDTARTAVLEHPHSVAARSPYAEVTISLHSFDPTLHEATATVSVDFVDDGNIFTNFSNPGSSSLSPDGSDQPKVVGTWGLPKDAPESITLHLNWRSGEPTRISIPLSDAVADGHFYDDDVRIPAVTTPTKFPQDRWEFHGTARLVLPTGVTVPSTGAGARSNDLPLAIAFKRDDRLDQWYLMGDPTTSPPKDGSPSDLRADISADLSRPLNTVLFVYVISLAPLLVGSAYLVGRRGSADETPAALSLAASMLSLMAIREVLTPNDIEGLTYLDRLLGLELVVLVAVFAHTTTAHLKAKRTAEPLQPSEQSLTGPAQPGGGPPT